MALGVALAHFPADPPKKYFGDNKIHLDLGLDSVAEFAMSGTIDESPGNFALSRDRGRCVATFENASCSIRVVAEVVGITKITSYVNNPLGPKV